jgi:hypothetical protein
MATKKLKKNISDFQSALLSNTPFIKQVDEPGHDADNVVRDEPIELIDPELLIKIKALAQYNNTSTSSIINKALTHFLRLKALEVETALKHFKPQP